MSDTSTRIRTTEWKAQASWAMHTLGTLRDRISELDKTASSAVITLTSTTSAIGVRQLSAALLTAVEEAQHALDALDTLERAIKTETATYSRALDTLISSGYAIGGEIEIDSGRKDTIRDLFGVSPKQLTADLQARFAARTKPPPS